MSSPARTPGKHTIADWLALPAEDRFELIDGEMVQKALPDVPHSIAQAGVIVELGQRFNRRGGGNNPGGWWICPELDIRLGQQGFRPDVSGWRRERVPVMPKERPVSVRPDWICEVLSESNSSMDTVKKLRRYHQAGIPHYWIVDPATETLLVHRYLPDGYQNVLAAAKGETVRAEPFEAIELRVGLFFGQDPDDPESRAG